jgi:two-component system, LytTR family, response regulator
MGVFEEGVVLVCGDGSKAALEALLIARRIPVRDHSSYAVVEYGNTLPEGKTCVVFEWNQIDKLIGLFGEPGENPAAATEPSPRSIVGRKANDTLEILAYGRICFFEARGNLTFCVTPEGEYRVKEKLYELETLLPGDRFIRVSRSYIANIQNVSQIVPWFGRRLVLRFNHTKAEVEVSKNYASSFKDFLGI